MGRLEVAIAALVACAVAVPITIAALPARLATTPGAVVARAAGPGDLFGVLLANSRDLGAVAANQPVSLLLLLKNPQAPREQAALTAMDTPHTPAFGRFATPASIEGYGPPGRMVRGVARFMARSGLTVRWQRGDDWLTVTGPAVRVEATFRVSVHRYVVPSGTRFYASARDATLPAALRASVAGAGHISSYVQPHQVNDIPANGLAPADLLAAYDMQPLRNLHLDGTGETVVFFEWDGFAQSDLDTFTKKFGLPPMHPTIAGGPTLGPGIETEMDMEVVHEIAPGAKLVLYNMGNDYSQEMPLQSQMVNNNRGAIISESWSECDKADSASTAQSFADIYNHADLLGESVFASTGDSGAYECLKAVTWGTAPAPQYIGAGLPASAPGVTGVGGTHLSVRQDGSWYNETVWEMPARTMGSGGAASSFFSRPSWQHAPGVSGAMRTIPDISADADGDSGAAIYTNNPGGSVWWEGGGTSQSAPIWAGMTALINQYLKSKGLHGAGFLNPALYHFASTTQPYPPFHDVTVGTNLVYSAGAGYDLATGLGTPDAWNLARDLEAYQRSGGQ